MSAGCGGVHLGGMVPSAAEYAETDLLCNRAKDPRELVEWQAWVWQPPLDCAMLRYDPPPHLCADVIPLP